jgi:hypothetical protein
VDNQKVQEFNKMASAYNLFVSFIFLQLFWAFGVTLIVPFIPAVEMSQVVFFEDSSGLINYQTLSQSLENGVTDQTNIPVLDFGALIYYSSNLLLTLMINFVTAVPQMILILLSAFANIFPLNYTIMFYMKTFFTLIMTVLYYLSLFLFITNIRGGNNVA